MAKSISLFLFLAAIGTTIKRGKGPCTIGSKYTTLPHYPPAVVLSSCCPELVPAAKAVRGSMVRDPSHPFTVFINIVPASNARLRLKVKKREKERQREGVMEREKEVPREGGEGVIKRE